MNYRLVYGLSADPIHQAHSDLLRDAAVALTRRGYAVTGALVVPVYRRNLPKYEHPAAYQDRLAMCRLAAAVAEEELRPFKIGVEVSRIEEELAEATGGPNYTVDTLAALRRADPETGLIFLMSSDLVSGDDPELGRWSRPEELAREAKIAVAVRPGYAPNIDFLRRFGPEDDPFILLTELSPAAMSAHVIRARLAGGADPMALADEGLLLPDVARYIGAHHLYSTA